MQKTTKLSAKNYNICNKLCESKCVCVRERERERERGTPSAGSVWFWAWANPNSWPKMQATQKTRTRRGDDPTMTLVEEQCNRGVIKREGERLKASHRYAKPPDQNLMFISLW